MHKGTMMDLCLMAVLGAVVVEVNASPDTDALPAQLLLNEVYKRSDFIIVWKKNLQHHCEEVSGEAHSMVIEEAMNKLIDCAGETMKNLHQHKTWDTFIPSLFKKAPEFGACVMELSTKIQVCLTDEEKRQSEFHFSRVGDQIAHFVANQGPQCLAVKMDSIINCGNKYSCVDLEQFESCVLHLLESFSDNTPVKVVQSIFKVVKNETNCPSGNKPSQGGIPVAAWVGIGLLIGIVVIVGVYLSYSKLVK